MRRKLFAPALLLATAVSFAQTPADVISKKSATALAWASASCEKMPDCIIRSHLHNENWVFIVTLVEGHDSSGAPIVGRSLRITFDPVGHVIGKAWADEKDLP
ncbi:MAG: hypothetical protein ACRDQZ_10005 [Mycobacteriales bacterium]